MEATGLKMTHEELLDKLSTIDFDKMGAFAFYKCLKAVAELHMPHDKHEGVCSGCYEEESGFSDYPCPTIQAITKELQ